MTRLEIIKSELKKLTEANEGMLTPEIVVDSARRKSSPLHSYFDWNDDTAADNYRKWQARQLIATVTVEVEEKEVNQYYNASVRVDDEKVQGYFPVEKVLADEDLYVQVLEEATKTLEHWQSKYGTLKDLKDVIDEKKLHKVKSLLRKRGNVKQMYG